MNYPRSIEFTIPEKIVKQALETYYRSISVINDNEDVRFDTKDIAVTMKTYIDKGVVVKKLNGKNR